MAEIKERVAKVDRVDVKRGSGKRDSEKKKVERRRGERLVEISKEAPIPREVKTWMEKFELDPSQQKSVSDDNTGQKILTAVGDEEIKVELPIDRDTFVAGFKKTLSEAGRWLSTFVFRIIKKNKGRVVFKKKNNDI
ncbi:hypothetical protein KKE45_01955 [Patescibacteria group bacterium]|nr:hypothetical protein [Patescibacteria group bacterium]